MINGEFGDPMLPIEEEKKPGYRLMITRHAERLPSGELSPEGIEHAKRKGQMLQDAEVIKAYASDHKMKRAYDTGELISRESGIVSQTGKPYATREVSGIQYDVLEPDLYGVIAEAKSIIEESTLRDAGMSTERDEAGKLKTNIEALPIEEKIAIAPIRQKNQKKGFDFILGERPEVVHRMAMGLSNQLEKEIALIQRYDRRRQFEKKPLEKDAFINTATHGMFMESLLKETGVMINQDGEAHPINDFDNPEFGGYIQPAESIYLDITDPNNIPDKIPVIFDGENRPKSGSVFVERAKIEQLARDYEEWRQSLEDQESVESAE